MFDNCKTNICLYHSYLSREEFAHWIMDHGSSIVRVKGLFYPDVSENFLAVSKELVEEERIRDEHGDDAHEEVQ